MCILSLKLPTPKNKHDDLRLAVPIPWPILFEVGNFAIRWYGLLIAIAVLIGVNLSQFLAKRRGIKPELLADYVIWGIIGAIPCARLYYVLFQWRSYADRPQDIIAIWQGGIAIHGAILAV